VLEELRESEGKKEERRGTSLKREIGER